MPAPAEVVFFYPDLAAREVLLLGPFTVYRIVPDAKPPWLF
jgi:hypothetical protein